MRKECSHLKQLGRDEIRRKHRLEQSCEVCGTKPPLVWVCLGPGCSAVECESRVFLHMGEHYKSKKHPVFINLFNNEMVCLECKAELLDHGMTPSPSATVDPALFRKENKLEHQSPSVWEEAPSLAHKKVRLGLCGLEDRFNSATANCALTVLLHFNFFRIVAKIPPGEIKAKVVKAGSLLGQFCELNSQYWSGQHIALWPEGFIKQLYLARPSFCTFKRRDPFDILVFILKEVCEQLKVAEGQQCLLNLMVGFSAKLQPSSQQCKEKGHKPVNLALQSLSISGHNLKRREQVEAIQIFKKKKWPFQYQVFEEKGLLNKLWGGYQFFPHTLEELLSNKFVPKSEDSLQCGCGQAVFKFQACPHYLLVHFKRISAQDYRVKDYPVKFPLTLDLGRLGMLGPECKDEGAYELASVCYLAGDGSYRTLCRHSKFGTWHQFWNGSCLPKDCSAVRQVQTPLFLVYQQVGHKEKRRFLGNQIKLYRRGEFKIPAERQVVLPFLWPQKFASLKDPGPILLDSKFCKHGLLKPNKEEAEPGGQVVDLQVYKVLREKHGGSQAEGKAQPCRECQLVFARLGKRKKRERQVILKLDNQLTDSCFLVSQKWLNLWSSYLYGRGESEPPGPIDNSCLLLQGKLRPGLESSQFKKVNEYVWSLLQGVYGGGPQITVGGKRLKNSCKVIPEKLGAIGGYVRQLLEWSSN